MSERISLTHDELQMLWWLTGEAMEGLGPEMEDDESVLAQQVTDKVRRAFTKAQRKRADRA